MSISINFHDAVIDTRYDREGGRVLQRHANGVPMCTIVTIVDGKGGDIAFYFREAAQAEEIAAAFQRAADLLTGAVVEELEVLA